MNLTLENFEQQVDQTILKRGLDYFKKGYVTEVEDLGGGDYEATVEGSEIYTVWLHIEGNEVTEYECDCPYDWGAICKHTVAVLFYLRKSRLGMDGLAKLQVHPKQKEESETQQMEKLLKQLSHDELKAFVRERCSADKNFKHLFVAKHISSLYAESKGLYAKQLKLLVKGYIGRHGFVEYREATKLGREVYGMLEEARAVLKKGKQQQALYMAEAVVEEMTTILDCSDDSDGEIGGCISESIDLLEELAGLDLSKKLHEELFCWLMDSFEKGLLKGWDGHFDLIEVAISLMDAKQEEERVKKALAAIKPTGDSWDWNYKQAQNLTLELIRKTEGEEAYLCYMEEHIENSDFREKAISKAMDEGDYAKAEKLALEGIRKDEKEYPGLADDWRDRLLDIYGKVHNDEQVIQLARYFLVQEAGRYHPRKYYYDLLKSLIPQEEWPKFMEKLVAQMSGKSRYDIDYGGISQLYIWESQWQKLFELLKKNANLNRIAEVEPYLADAYAMELAGMYRDLILVYMEHNMGRDHYQNACRYIRRMIGLGAETMAKELIDRLRKLYPARRAMIEELSRV